MKLFVAYLQAIREQDFSRNIRTRPAYVVARDDNSAFGLAMKDAIECFPASDGWAEHAARVLEIPPEVISQCTQQCKASGEEAAGAS